MNTDLQAERRKLEKKLKSEHAKIEKSKKNIAEFQSKLEEIDEKIKGLNDFSKRLMDVICGSGLESSVRQKEFLAFVEEAAKEEAAKNSAPIAPVNPPEISKNVIAPAETEIEIGLKIEPK